MGSFQQHLSTHPSRKPELGEQTTNIRGVRPPTCPKTVMVVSKRSIWQAHGKSKPLFPIGESSSRVSFQAEGDFYYVWIPNAWSLLKIFPTRPTSMEFSLRTLVAQAVPGPSRAVLSGDWHGVWSPGRIANFWNFWGPCHMSNRPDTWLLDG
jgi:hypothetical protein